MRIITWNCNLTLSRKLEPLLALAPDVAVIQECERDLRLPTGYTFHWTGGNDKKGLGVLALDGAAHLERVIDERWAYFLPVTLPTIGLRLLATWAFNHRAAKISPLRIGMALPVIESLADWLAEGRSVVIGDFNNNVAWDVPRGRNNFAGICSRLEALGLTSAYHAARDELHGRESAMTHYFQKNPERGFHIDYCFLHSSLHAGQVTVPAFEQWRKLSDHVPVIVDISPGHLVAQ